MDEAHRYPIRVDRKLGFIDRRGEEIIPPIHTAPPGAAGLTGFYGGVAWVFVDGEYGLLDPSGALLFRASFDVVLCFSTNGRAKVVSLLEARQGPQRLRDEGLRSDRQERRVRHPAALRGHPRLAR